MVYKIVENLVKHCDEIQGDQLEEEIPAPVEESPILNLEDPIWQAYENLCGPELTEPREESLPTEGNFEEEIPCIPVKLFVENSPLEA